jgi:prophage antirepressor-like protein
MTTEVQVFSFEDNNVRTQMDDAGQPWFNANDVCKALDLTNPRKAIGDHVDAEDVTKFATPTAGGVQRLNFITEAGVYALIMGSTKPEAKKFKRWVTHEVLPTLRKTGAYTSQPKKKPEAIDAPFKLGKSAYGFYKLIGLDKNAAAIAANQAVISLTGTNLLLAGGTTHLESESQQHYFNVTELGSMIGVSAIRMNLILEAADLQERVFKKLVATEKGKQYSRIYDVGKANNSGVPVTQLKWSKDVLEVLNVE